MQSVAASDLIHQHDVPAYLNGAVSVQTLTNWRYRGVGPRYTKIGRKVLYRRADLDAWLTAQARDPEASSKLGDVQ